MKRALCTILLCAVVAAGTNDLSSAESDAITKYLGLAVPYPADTPDLSVPDSATGEIQPRDYRLHLTIDSSGVVRDVQDPLDSVFPYPTVMDHITKTRFQFFDGRPIPPPHIVPVTVSVPRMARQDDSLALTFPVSQEMLTDSTLLDEYFQLNDIQAPKVTHLPPVSYVFDSYDTAARYWTVTMQVSLDESGELQDITYPNPAQSDMAHKVHMAVMNASFAPARLGSEPIAAEFLLTFRIFKNIDYPFSPYQPEDTARPEPVTARYFMTQYYNENDISLYPLPHKHARGFIRGSKFRQSPFGFADVLIAIDSAGKPDRIVVTRCSSGLREAAYKAARLISWYPAVTPSGATAAFTGQIRLEFSGTSKVVYIPEWFSF